MFARPFANLVGERRAERFLQLGTLLTPEEALQVGLIDAVVDSEDELMATAVETLAKYQVTLLFNICRNTHKEIILGLVWF